LQWYYDGVKIIEYTDLIIRTNQHATMKFNQFLIAPWIDSSPADQTMWIDDLTVSSARPVDTSPPIDTTPPNTPTGVNIQIIQ